MWHNFANSISCHMESLKIVQQIEQSRVFCYSIYFASFTAFYWYFTFLGVIKQGSLLGLLTFVIQTQRGNDGSFLKEQICCKYTDFMKERQAQAHMFSTLLKLDRFSVRFTNYISIQYWIDIKPSDQDKEICQFRSRFE